MNGGTTFKLNKVDENIVSPNKITSLEHYININT
jgi:hypothetical protein